MAQNSGQEKTEQATPKRRKDARKEGNVFQSRDVSTVAVLIGVFFLAMFFSLISINRCGFIWYGFWNDQ